MTRRRTRTPMAVPEGTAFGELTVIGELERSGRNRRMLCRCTCGRETVKFLGNLRQGRSKSCGDCEIVQRHRRVTLAKIVATRRKNACVTDEGRICGDCKQWLPWSRFGRDTRRDIGYASSCFTCTNWRSTKLLYQITRADYEWLLEQQGGLCALCCEPPSSSKRLDIDHDHTCHPGTAKACKRCIRGLLCTLCNRVIGLSEKRAGIRARFADYLERRPFA